MMTKSAFQKRAKYLLILTAILSAHELRTAALSWACGSSLPLNLHNTSRKHTQKCTIKPAKKDTNTTTKKQKELSIRKQRENAAVNDLYAQTDVVVAPSEAKKDGSGYTIASEIQPFNLPTTLLQPNEEKDFLYDEIASKFWAEIRFFVYIF